MEGRYLIIVVLGLLIGLLGYLFLRPRKQASASELAAQSVRQEVEDHAESKSANLIPTSAVEQEERARLAAEAKTQLEMEALRVGAEAGAVGKADDEQARVANEAKAFLRAKERARIAEEAEARLKAEEEQRARVEAQADARRQAEEAARLAAKVKARREVEEEERARVTAAEAEVRRQVEETARLVVEAEARRRAEEEEQARVAAAEDETRGRSEEAARLAAEAGARHKGEDEERTRVAAAEAEVPQQAEQAARLAVEAEARRKAEEEAQVRVAAEAEIRRQAEAVARLRAQGGEEEAAARPPAAEEEGQPAVGEESIPEEAGAGVEPTASSAPRTRAPRYHGPAGGAPSPRQPRPSGPTTALCPDTTEGASHALPVELRILFDRADSLRVTLLPRRASGLPDELMVRTPSGTVDLVALQDDWYQDVAPADLDALLRDGVLWRDDSTQQEWLLSGREVFVLAPGTAHRGLVSCARLVLGREHAVLCMSPWLPAVEAVLRQAGCEGWTQFDENDGAPRGWIVLRGVLPRHPVSWTDTADILNVLRPLPQIDIALEGGICLGYASWLAEHPPGIRVYGDPDHARAVRIDGQDATMSDDGGYIAPGWDSLGLHQVWCNGVTRTYSLVLREPPAQAWAAFSFPSPDERGGGRRIAICGPLVRAFTSREADGEDAATSEIIQVPPDNPVLLGSLPGQVFVTHPRPDVRGANCIASVPFAPIWALPAQPLLCDKKVNRVRLIGESLAPGDSPDASVVTLDQSSIEKWCRAIRDAGRKGLQVEPATPEVADLWRRYKKYAQNPWRWNR